MVQYDREEIRFFFLNEGVILQQLHDSNQSPSYFMVLHSWLQQDHLKYMLNVISLTTKIIYRLIAIYLPN